MLDWGGGKKKIKILDFKTWSKDVLIGGNGKHLRTYLHSKLDQILSYTIRMTLLLPCFIYAFVTRTGYVIFCRIFFSPWLKWIVCCFVGLVFFLTRSKILFSLKIPTEQGFLEKLHITRKGFSEHFRFIIWAATGYQLSCSLPVFLFYNTILEAFAIGIFITNKHADFCLFLRFYPL